MKKFAKLSGMTLVIFLGGIMIATPAQAATHSTGCKNDGSQAILQTSNFPGVVCFSGTGAAWSGYIPAVRAASSGSHFLAIGQYGTDNPIVLAPHTSRSFAAVGIEFVQRY